ncbi:MAG: hypothetical protein OXI60_01355 [Acidiferrobacterales bacterium]|nr:hypothetical protein [Acidiferrobacterales bacterium]
MSEKLAMCSPLNTFNGDDAPRVELQGVVLTELPFLRYANVRFQSDDAQPSRKFRRLMGFDVPLDPNTFILHEENLCAWLGPDEWLVITPPHVRTSLDAMLNEFVSDNEFSTCVDISASQTIIRAVGPKTIELLGRGVTYDLHPSNFSPGCCVQTMLARTAVTLLAQTAEDLTIDIVVRRSFADYLWRWLNDAGQESAFYPG